MDEILGGAYSNQGQPDYQLMQQAKMARMPTLKERLDLAVAQAEEKLVAVKRAREIFEKNPDLEELLNIMQRSHF